VKVLVTGDRSHKNVWIIWTILQGIKSIYPKMVLVVGDASGADQSSWGWAKQNKTKRRRYKANWSKLGRAAGPRRNLAMLDREDPEIVIGFHDNLWLSKGTKHCLTESVGRGKETYLVIQLNEHNLKKLASIS